MKLFTTKRHWYWACQAVGWGAFWGTQVQASFMLKIHEPGTLTWLTVAAGLGLLLTHGYRGLLLRFGVLRLPLGWQAVAAGAGLLGLAVAMQLLAPVVYHGVQGQWRWRVAGEPAAFFFGVVGVGRYLIVWVLAYHFFAVGERLAQAEVGALRAEAARRQVELDLLRSQINPHFLFNALNSVRALTLSDPHRARTAVTQLADLLRYTLNYEQRQLIPLGEELAAVRDYLALEQTRFGPERLRLELAVPEALLAWPVPPAALLTLVENAVKHGIGATPGGGVLRLLGWPEPAPAGAGPANEGARLHLEVSQPGRLPAPGTARPVPAAAHAGGLGLTNTRQRLRALYGEAASLTLHEHPQGTVVAHLGVPHLVVSC